MIVYHLLKEYDRYVIVRTPDYKSTTWNDNIDVLINHDFSKFTNFGASLHKGQSIEQTLESFKNIKLLCSSSSPIKIKEDFPELFI